MSKVYLLGGMRTPFGNFGGYLSPHTPVDLALLSAREALARLKINPDKLDQVILSNVLPATTDTLYGGRHLALKVGAINAPGLVINRLCGSGIEAILNAYRLIKLREADCVLVSGAENMSMAPHLTYGGRFGTKYGPLKSVDMLLDLLTDKYCNIPMGMTAENLAEMFNISREECDQYSFDSHEKVRLAYKYNFLSEEIIKNFGKDEHFRPDVSLAAMRKMDPTFKENGRVTAASASGIVDGSASVLICSESFCENQSLDPWAEIVAGAVVAVDPKIMGIGPSPAIKNLLEKRKISLANVDLFEINEAFAAQILAVIKDLGISREKVNIWGGAISLGHPLGATGVRITLTLARQLKALKLRQGIASACIGGGQGIALMIQSTD